MADALTPDHACSRGPRGFCPVCDAPPAPRPAERTCEPCDGTGEFEFVAGITLRCAACGGTGRTSLYTSAEMR